MSTFGVNDPQLRAILDAKGRADGQPVATNANAAPFRRVLSLAAAFAGKPLSQCRVLDLACQEGGYGLEAAVAGASVIGVDARPQHLDRAKTCAAALGLQDRIAFEIGDVRRVSAETHGRFDLILMLGILYHLDARDAAATLQNLAGMTDTLIIDTHVSLAPKSKFSFAGRSYDGEHVREHGDADSPERRMARGQASLDNTFAFYFAKPALARLLMECGFSFVLEALAPLDATKPQDRVTLIALKRSLHEVRLYPWINGLSEDEIAAAVRQVMPSEPTGLRAKVARLANLLLHPLGFTLARR